MTTRRLACAFFLPVIVTTLLGMPGSASAAPAKLDKMLQVGAQSGTTGQVPVIITAVTGQRGAVRTKLYAKGRPINAEHPAINAISATVDAADLMDLAADPSVASVSLDAPVNAHATSAGADSLVSLDLLRAMVGGTTSGLTGRSVGVAILDSGIAPVPDLKNQITAFYNFTNGGKAALPLDDFGHGTHIAATIASTGQQSAYLYQGVAPGVRLIGFKVLDKNGNGATSNVISALTFATANKAALGIDVINLSLGHPIYESVATDPLVQAVEQAVHAGIVVVVSAGNVGINPATGLPGYGGITSPGNAPSAITVGVSTPGENLTVPPGENLTDRRGDEPQVVVCSVCHSSLC